MIKKSISYTDFRGNERTEDFYFHLSKTELVKYSYYDGGLEKRIRDIVEAENAYELMNIVEEIIKMSYGERSEDGRRFMKSEEISRAFMETEAYSELFMTLINDSEEMEKFINGLVTSVETNPYQLPKNIK